MPHAFDLLGAGKQRDFGIDIITPVAGDVSIEWAQRTFNLSSPDGKPSKIHFHRGDTVDVARDLLLDKAMLTESSEWMFWLDSDVIPPANVLETLIGHDLPIVSGLYNSKTPGLPWGMWNYNEKSETVPVIEWEGRLIEVDVVGFGCILVKKDVVRKMREMFKLPAFFYSRNRSPLIMDKLDLPDPRMKNCGEDFFFCLLAKACGYKIMVDTEVKCSHYGRLKVDNGAIASEVI
jgi:hypothetical protein